MTLTADTLSLSLSMGTVQLRAAYKLSLDACTLALTLEDVGLRHVPVGGYFLDLDPLILYVVFPDVNIIYYKLSIDPMVLSLSAEPITPFLGREVAGEVTSWDYLSDGITSYDNLANQSMFSTDRLKDVSTVWDMEA